MIFSFSQVIQITVIIPMLPGLAGLLAIKLKNQIVFNAPFRSVLGLIRLLDFMGESLAPFCGILGLFMLLYFMGMCSTSYNLRFIDGMASVLGDKGLKLARAYIG
jgi:hypothetical protein